MNVYVRSCKGINCNVVLNGHTTQKIYCSKCKKLRGKALFFARELRKEVKILSENVYDYDIEVKYLDSAMLLRAQHKDNSDHNIQISITGSEDIDIAILLKHIYKGLRYISNKGKKYKKIL